MSGSGETGKREGLESEGFVFTDVFGFLGKVKMKTFLSNEMSFALMGILDANGIGGENFGFNAESFSCRQKNESVGVGDF